MTDSPSSGKTHLGGIDLGTPLIRRALLFSFWDGIMNNGMVALNDTFSVAAAIALGASSLGIACLTALPLLLGSLAQFFLPALANPAKGRKPYVLMGVRGQIILLFFAGFSGWLPERVAPWAYVILFVCAAVSANLTGPYWVGWMGDLIPGPVRGRHFAWRSVAFSWMYLSCSLFAGAVTRHYNVSHAPWILFTCVFTLAIAFRTGSYACMRLQHEPPPALSPEPFSPLSFRPGTDFFAYCVATGLFQGSVLMLAPFYSVWFLRDLHFSYFSMAMTLCMNVLGSLLFARSWGKLADRIGAGTVLWLGALLTTSVPFLYLFTVNRWIVWAICFFSGSSWSGYTLANFNLMLHATDRRHRSHYIAFSSVIIGPIGCGLSLLGGVLATRLPVWFSWRLQSLFLVAGLLRLAIFWGLFGRFRGKV